MIRAQLGLSDREASLVEGLCFLIFELTLAKEPQDTKCLGNQRVISTQCLFSNGQRAPRECLPFLVAGLFFTENGETLQAIA